MVNTCLYHWLEKNKVLDNNQSGFRRGCRTGDPLFRLVQDVIDGFQVGKTTTAVFIDLQQAYDRVWRKGLLAIAWKFLNDFLKKYQVNQIPMEERSPRYCLNIFK